MPFEILALHGETWQIEATVNKKSEIEEVAAQILGESGVSGVRVVQDSILIEKSINDLEEEDFIFEKIKEAVQEKIFVGEIDSAPDCKVPEDLLKPDALKTLNRLFRKYLDKNDITAMEVLHNGKEIKRLNDADTLVPSAIGKVAKIQSENGDASSNERRDILFEFMQEITNKANQAEGKGLPAIKNTGFTEAISSLKKTASQEELVYSLNVIIAKELIDTRSYWGKLLQTVRWASDLEDKEAEAALDLFVADILANNMVIQDLLGDQLDLGSAVIEMLDLGSGSLETGDIEELQEEGMEWTKAKLNQIMARPTFKVSQLILLERAEQQIAGSGNLSKEGEAGEQERFKAILDRVITKNEVLGGAQMAEALTERQTRLINKGGLTGLKEAINTLIPSLQSPARKIAFLLSIAASKMAEEKLEEFIQEHIETLLIKPSSINGMVSSDLPPNRKMEQITSSFYQIEKSQLDPELKEKITAKLDEILAAYLEESKIIEKIDNPSRPMHLRAMMLVGMCQSEMLPKGKASNIARGVITEHLKKPDFNTELVAQVEEAEKEKVIARFQSQLKRAGISV
ncbi:MAG: hypothetical protein VX987_13215 [Pseudomonadota bacterium]|nr:hypothetical protein [Pseudomonadota bacterium]